MPSRRRRSRSRSRSSSRRHAHTVHLRLKHPAASPLALPPGARRLNVEVKVGRNKDARKQSQAFIACASLGPVQKCSTSHAPMRAVAAALRMVATRGDKSGAFGALGRVRRRRRRR